MKTAISIPDGEFDRYERLAARHGLNRSEFYRRAALKLADELETRTSALTGTADDVIHRLGQPIDPLLLAESERVMATSEW